ncbi:phosphohydrolase (plasmid) [Pseudoalteromonas lipolytica]|uniref:Phosphohydrolase n=1 Tax=Pseudoalteromonas lipolytica TaxID=570156 RepID=A0AAD0S426_9GAMM|nr:phosphohydrolase [Pseudoalteromonas donghaensis]AXV67640.1 phosphohydrolase [Pseudoalteromonas donghaensis]|tara:strand:- start:451 stop:1581 length:1131 start_codon:yes stop_codon:yes gene_type:complete
MLSSNIAEIDKHDDQITIPTLRQGLLATSDKIIALEPAMPGVYFNAPDIELNYDVAVVCMSGGKDSFAALKRLLDIGFPKSKIEMWHHLVDGNEGSTLMDWAFIDDYCVKFSEAVGIPLYFSWLKHGFEGEMLKNDSKSHSHIIQTPEGLIELTRNNAKTDTRLKFPQQAASLQTRWCSSALKIDVGRRGITSQDRFIGKRVLFVTGERREESGNRARYNQLEPHAGDTLRKSKSPRKPRHIDAWRPVLHYSEEQVWQSLADWRLVAPVPYRLGWSRSSCQTCIFNGDRIWATIGQYFPEKLKAIADYERQFATAISRKGLTVSERAAIANPLIIDDQVALMQASHREYTLPIFLREGEAWKLPAGAFGIESSGAS